MGSVSGLHCTGAPTLMTRGPLPRHSVQSSMIGASLASRRRPYRVETTEKRHSTTMDTISDGCTAGGSASLIKCNKFNRALFRAAPPVSTRPDPAEARPLEPAEVRLKLGNVPVLSRVMPLFGAPPPTPKPELLRSNWPPLCGLHDVSGPDEKQIWWISFERLLTNSTKRRGPSVEPPYSNASDALSSHNDLRNSRDVARCHSDRSTCVRSSINCRNT
mmetsp:Transcript_18112/g.48655  ORF Transcript_18112/g.48655 Transcript_18112/m.48655 type:complete len:218 (-) Transcript_18112:1148-1801(-)